MQQQNIPIGTLVAFGGYRRSGDMAKTTAFAAECHQFLLVAGLTANPPEVMLKPAALQVVVKFVANESGDLKDSSDCP